jgi:hypothetical protein
MFPLVKVGYTGYNTEPVSSQNYWLGHGAEDVTAVGNGLFKYGD